MPGPERDGCGLRVRAEDAGVAVELRDDVDGIVGAIDLDEDDPGTRGEQIRDGVHVAGMVLPRSAGLPPEREVGLARRRRRDVVRDARLAPALESDRILE